MTNTKTYKPLSVRHRKLPNSFIQLEEGVPDYMFPLLRDWLLSTSLFDWEPTMEGRYYSFTMAGREFLLVPKRTFNNVCELLEDLEWDHELFLDAIDYCLAFSITEPTEVYNVDWQALERILLKGRSAWTVAPRRNKLIRRLPEETQKVLEDALSSGDASAEHLSDAWQDGWSRNPNASSSYLSGIMAIESAIRSIVSPNKGKATLGTMINEIKDKPSKWRTRFDGDDSAGVVSLTNFLQAIWEAHVRHGSDEYALVTLEQARDVCQVALLVVTLANSRGLERVES